MKQEGLNIINYNSRKNLEKSKNLYCSITNMNEYIKTTIHGKFYRNSDNNNDNMNNNNIKSKLDSSNLNFHVNNNFNYEMISTNKNSNVEIDFYSTINSKNTKRKYKMRIQDQISDKIINKSNHINKSQNIINLNNPILKDKALSMNYNAINSINSINTINSKNSYSYRDVNYRESMKSKNFDTKLSSNNIINKNIGKHKDLNKYRIYKCNNNTNYSQISRLKRNYYHIINNNEEYKRKNKELMNIIDSQRKFFNGKLDYNENYAYLNRNDVDLSFVNINLKYKVT